MLEIKRLEVSNSSIDELYAKGQVTLASMKEALGVNDYVILVDRTDQNHSTLARYDGNKTFVPTLNRRTPDLNGIRPRDAKQSAFVDCLLQKNILLNVAVGSAGTGKTTLALAYAAEKYMDSGKP